MRPEDRERNVAETSWRARELCLGFAILVASCGGCGATQLPPFGQARVRVLTDAPVPGVVSRLRLDVYAGDGRWLESRDASVREPSEWPVSFTVFSSDVSQPARVRIRVRGYREGALRDYRGERYLAPPPAGASQGATPPEVPRTDEPRLLGASDRTPPSEPSPESAIDRMVWVTLAEGTVSDVSIVLRVACAGTMADLRRDRTCIDGRGSVVGTPEASREERGVADWERRLVEDERRLPPPRAGRVAPEGTPLFDEEILVRGGAYVLGSRAETSRTFGPELVVTAVPERVFVAPPLLVDKYEVTVGRFRDATRRGFVPPDAPITNDSPFNRETPGGLCTFVTVASFGASSRETMPVTCVSLPTARAFCRFEGGDLLTEAQWEYLATAEARSAKSAFPWGDYAPSCADAVFGRVVVPSPFEVGAPCGVGPATLGPLPVDAGARDETPSGVHGLGANVAEWVRGSYRPYDAACWARAPLYDPACEDSSQYLEMARGSSWVVDALPTSATRIVVTGGSAYDSGIRCARLR